MSNNLESSTSDMAARQPAGADLSSQALARRKMLLNSLGKGSVVMAAAAVPMHTLASNSTRCKTDGKNGPPVIATVSGMHSAIGSQHTVTDTSEGHSCGHYKTKENWPGYNDNKDRDTSCREKTVKNIFSGCNSSLRDKSLWKIVNDYSDRGECRWVVAWLNAGKSDLTHYPYDRSEVCDMYNNAGVGGRPSRQDCETFFGTHMENRS